MAEVKLKITKHAHDKMLWLGVTEEQVKETITRGSQFKQTEGFLAKYRYLSVAYKKLGKNVCKIKTVYI